MKRIFTLLFCFFGLVIFSQEYKFEITPEGGQKKTFNVLRSTAFGNQNPGTITKEVIKSDKFLACSNDLPTVDFAGNIAVVERGVCGFTEKVKNAQTKGATAVIVCNNQAGIIAMGGTDAT
ncbi:MAG TPA: hypothetical protein PKD85_11485, partial [Saprospiraceae bacterium]|nr:hypothetical protein [Saprospiraceae bacterium]